METPFNFLGIPEFEPKNAEVIVLPVPFEETTSYGQGTKSGPAAIIEASRQIELFDHELGDELPNAVKIATLPSVTGGREEITKAAAEHVDKFLISLGGEHSITPLLVKPFLDKYPKLSILQIDAHTDMRDEWEGRRDSHACAMRRAQELDIKQIVSVGIRSTSTEEQPYLKEKNIFWGNEFDLEKVVARLSEDVYLSFDVDGLDISIMPATGTPEPGGLSYGETLDILKAVAQKKNLVAADFVELAPVKGLPAYDFLVAKLIYKLIGYKFGGTGRHQ